jgi:hypothetical protein
MAWVRPAQGGKNTATYIAIFTSDAQTTMTITDV